MSECKDNLEKRCLIKETISLAIPATTFSCGHEEGGQTGWVYHLLTSTWKGRDTM